MPNHNNHPHIILIILDAVRARNVSAHGYSRRTTPFLDQFAAQNLFFRRAIAPATWTIPTHASILSGLYLSQHRLENLQGNRRFNAAIRPLPALLRDNGYRTAGFSQNILFSAQHNLTDGFQEFYQLEDFLNLPRRTGRLARHNGHASQQESALTKYRRKLQGPRRLFDEMLHWLNAAGTEQPLFLMTNITNAHYPWAPPPGRLLTRLGRDLPYIRKREFVTPAPFRFNSGKKQLTERHRRMWLAFYDTAIHHVDQETGRFLHQLQQWPGWDNTIVIITADHGELLGDYRDIVGHTLTVSDHLLHVPLIIRHPDYTTGVTIQGVVQTLDLFPSLVQWSTMPTGELLPAQLQRPPLAEAIANATDATGYAFAEEDYTDSYDVIHGLRRVNPHLDPQKYPRQQIAVRSATYKYIWFDDRPGEFYDLTADPDEKHNLLPGLPAIRRPVLDALQQALTSWRSGLEPLPPRDVTDVGEMDAEVVSRLRDLGYIG